MNIDIARPANAAMCQFAVSLPPKELHPNARAHWAVRSGRTNAYRFIVKVATQQYYRQHGDQDVPTFARAVLSLTYVFRTNRTRDDDNLIAWWKAGRDGLVDARLLISDGPAHLTIGRVTSRVQRGVRGHVIVEVVEQEDPHLTA